MLAIAGAGAARADCPAANQFAYSFAGANGATLNYGNSYSYTATSTSAGNRSFTVSFQTFGLTSSVINGAQMPAINTLINDGGTTNRNLMIGGTFGARTAVIGNNSNVIVTRFTFAQAVRDFTIQVNDIDFSSDQYRDWLQVTGSNGAASYTPVMTTPFGQTNQGTGPRTATNSSLTLGPTTTPVTIAQSQATGTGISDNQDNAGTVTASFAQPVTVIELRYANYPYSGTDNGGTGQQAYGIQRVSFCPLPSLTAVKSSTPYVTASTDPARFNIPGADVLYTISVTNTGGSPAELSGALLTDVLPPQVRFYNGDIDGAGPLTGPLEAIYSGGTTVTGGAVAYSNNAGSSYTYTPVAGYDPAVDALRMSGTGTIPAGGAITLRFRARID